MTAAAEIQRYTPGSRPAHVSQATAVEQSRAIAEVQAAVVVAQSCPRDMAEAEREMEYVCGRLDMAEQAFYQVDNRGTGPSVHLMRELARIWGNTDYGVKELHRDDEKGVSEVQAFAWDIQKNTRSSRTFINPHARMKGRGVARERVQLVDLTDIYLSNQNIGARAVRECISTILPRWFTEKAQTVCHNTLQNGEGEPLQDRIAKMITWFQGLGVSEKQLEARIGKKRGAWTPEDLAQMKIAGQSLNRGEVSKDELFPPEDATTGTADEIAAAPPNADREKAATAARQKLEKDVVAAAVAADESEKNAAAQADAPAAPDATKVTVEESRGGDSDTEKADTAVEEESTAAPATVNEPEPPPAEDPAHAPADDTAARNKLLDRLAGLFLNAGVPKGEAENRCTVAAHILDHPVTSIDRLSTADLAQLNTELAAWKRKGNFGHQINEVINNAFIQAENANLEGTQSE